MPEGRLMTRRLLTAIGTSVLLIAAMMPAAAAAAAPQASAQRAGHQFTKAGVYIVQMVGLPVVAYDGSVKGLKAT